MSNSSIRVAALVASLVLSLLLASHVVQAQAPSAPTSFTATTGDDKLKLTWSASSNATSYDVYRATTSGGEGGTPYATGIAVTAYTDTNVANGNTFYYTASAVNSSGTSTTQSNEAGATATSLVTTLSRSSSAGAAPVVLSWTTITGATSYSVYRSTTSGGEGTTAYASGIAATGYTDTAVASGGTFYYKFRGVTLGGSTSNSNEVSATVISTPAGLAATAGSAQIILNWSSVGAATSYTLLRGTTSGGESQLQTGLTTVSYTDAGLSAGTAYYYEVEAVASAGTSAPSGEVSGTTAPPIPTGLVATATNAQVTLSWTAAATASTYSVYRSTTSGGEGGTAFAVGIAITSYTDTTVTNGTKYYFTVAGLNAAGASAQSSEVNATPELTAPTSPTAVDSGTTITVSWSSVTNTSTYSLLRGTSSGGEGSYKTGLTPAAYTDTGLSTDTTYYYEVEAVSTGSTSPASVEVSATTVAAAPTSLTATTGYEKLKLAWGASAGAASYNVYRGTTAGGESGTPYATGITITAYTDTSVANGSTCYYKVAAVSASGTSAMSNEAGATATALVTTLTATTASGGLAPVTLSWTTITGATSYSVYRSTTSGGEGTTAYASGITATSYTDTGVASGGSYYYTFKGITLGGTTSASNEVHETLTPAVPAGLAVTSSTGATLVVLSWTASAGATSYSVYRGATSGGESGTSISGAITTASYTDTGAAAGSTYYYVVKAADAGGTSAASAETSTTVTPAAPTLTATAGVYQVALSWTSATGATSYSVYRAMTSGGETTPALQSGVTGTGYTDTSVGTNVTYYYTVRAVNAGGTSSMSNEASTTLVKAMPFYQINCGGTTVSPFAADEEFSGGTLTSVSNTISTSDVTAAAPMAVYQTVRYANEFSYTLPGLIPSGAYTVRLHFAENWDTGPDERLMNVSINGTQVLSGFDVYAAAGAQYTAVIVPFLSTANGGGNITIQFSAASGSSDTNAMVSGIEVVSNTAVPASPSGLTATTATGGLAPVTLSWTAPAGPTSYDIYRGTTSGGEGGSPYASGITTTTYADTAAAAGASYYYLVTGVNAAGTSAASNEASALLTPAAPTALAASLGNAQVTLTWTGSAGATSYSVYRSSTSGGETTPALYSGITTTSYTDASVANGSQYYYTLVAVNSAGTSAQSNEASTIPNVTPGAPTALTATAGNEQVTLNWSASSGATAYCVYRGTTAGGESTTPVQVGVAGTTCTVTGLTNATTYYFTVAATNSAGTSTASNEASATPALSAPAAPTGLTAAGGPSEITLTWSASPSATSYNVYRGLSLGGISGTAIATGVTVLTYVDPNLTDGTEYFYEVKAVNADGTSAYSSDAYTTPTVGAESGPQSTLILGSDGWLYGTTYSGGPNVNDNGGSGTVFKYNPADGATQLLHVFSGVDGANPIAGVIQGIGGTLYGTTFYCGPTSFAGTVYSIDSSNNFTTLYNFQDLSDGGNPVGGVVQDSSGALYGTTSQQYYTPAYGTVFDLDYSSLTTLHTFDDLDGAHPMAGLAVGADGNYYGTTESDSDDAWQNGTAFQITPTGAFTNLGDFGATMSHSEASLTLGSTGTFYGTATGGAGYGEGAVFNLTTAGAVSVLYNFGASNALGIVPTAPVTMLSDGSLYGTTEDGGASSYGTVWKIDPSGSYSVIHSFTGTISGDAVDSDGAYPMGGLVLANDGNLYGTTSQGGAVNDGTIYQVSPTGNYSLALSLNTPLAAPGGFTASVSSSTCAALSWNAVPGAESYNVMRGTSSSGPFTTVANTTSTSDTDCSLTTGTTYYYEVTAVINNAGNAPTLVLSVTPSSAAPGPSPLTATAGSGSVILNWGAVTGATTYSVGRSLVSGGAYSTVASVTAPTVAYTDTGLTNNTTYYYVVSAATSGGQTQNSAQAYATPDTPGPASLTATAGNAVVHLSWGSITPLTNYKVKRSESSVGPWVTIATPATTAYTDTTVTNGTTYYYTVSAVNSSGETANSNVVSATPALTPPVPYFISAVPGNAEVTLTLGVDESATSFNFKRALVTGGPYTTVANIPAPVDAGYPIYTDSSVTNGTTYFYVCSALNAGGESANSAEVNATPEASPAAVTDLTATAGNAQITLGWTSIASATSYAIMRGAASGGPYTLIETDPTPTSDVGPVEYTDYYGLSNGTAYYYVIIASSVGGTSASSNQASATPILPASGIPQGVIAVAGNSAVALSWTAATAAYGYDVLRGNNSGGPYALVSNQLTATNFTDSGLTNGENYYYMIQSVNTSGTSAASSQVSAMPEPTDLSSAQVIQIAQTFCATTGAPVTGAGTATFPAPSELNGLPIGDWRPRWLVTFGSPVSAKLEVGDTTGEVAYYYNYALTRQVVGSALPAGTPISQANALNTAATVLYASSQTEALANPSATYFQSSSSGLESGQTWMITYQRVVQGLPCTGQQATVLLQGDTGAVRGFGLNYPAGPPAAVDYAITSAQALQTAQGQLTAAGLTGATSTAIIQEIVMPNSFWQTYNESPSEPVTNVAAWDCYFQIPDPTNPQLSDPINVFVDAGTGSVIGGGVLELFGTSPHAAKLYKIARNDKNVTTKRHSSEPQEDAASNQPTRKGGMLKQ